MPKSRIGKGRPPSVQIKVSYDELDFLKEHCTIYGTTVAELFRKLVLKGLKYKPAPQDTPKNSSCNPK